MNIHISKRVTALFLAALLFAWGGVAGCRMKEEDAPEPPETSQPHTAPSTTSSGASLSGHERMLALLRRIAEDDTFDNEYVGTKKLFEQRAKLAALTDDSSLVDRLRVYKNLAIEELRVGTTNEAIRLFTEAYNMIPKLDPKFRRDAAIVLAYNTGVAYLRLGEDLNCVARHTPESCLLPLRGGGIHVDQEAARSAIEYFDVVIQAAHDRPTYRLSALWLLNIAYMLVGEYPDGVPEPQRIDPDTFASDVSFPEFTNIAADLGIDVFDYCGGAIVDDFDGDGHLDIVSSTSDATGQLRYFRSNGDGSYTERTSEAGLDGLFGGLNINHADYDNDGDLDILVLRGAWFPGAYGLQPNSLLRNNGDATFVDVTFEAGLGDVHYPTQTAGWMDFDNDGDLDLYIGNEATLEVRNPNQLFLNNGDGTFTDIAKEAGVQDFRYTKSIAWGDYDGDGFFDLYVSNQQQPNRLYKNQGDGTFRDVAPELGLTLPLNAFVTWFWDFDNDGLMDLYVASYKALPFPDRLHTVVASYLDLPHPGERSRLYRGVGEGRFVEVGEEMNLGLTTQTMGANFGDLNNDGFLDFYLGTGYPFYDGLMPNVMYLNLSGKRFADVTTAGRFGHLQKGHGICFADLDGDGDQDVFQQMGGHFPGYAFGNVLYENPGFGNHWIKIRLVGRQSNRFAIGARIRIDVQDGDRRRSIYKVVNSGGSFGSNPYLQHLGLGGAVEIDTLEIRWPATGKAQTFRDLAVDQRIEIVEGQPSLRIVPERSFRFAR